MNKRNGKIDIWLERLNKPLLSKSPFLWVQNYPRIIYVWTLLVFIVVLMLPLPTEQPGTNAFYFQVLVPFLPLIVIWWDIAREYSKTDIVDYYQNKGLFDLREEKKVLHINLALVSIPLLLCLINLDHRYHGKQFPTSSEYNQQRLYGYVKGEYYFLQQQGIGPEKSMAIFRDSVYPFLYYRDFPSFDSAALGRCFKDVAATDASLLLTNYYCALNDPFIRFDGALNAKRYSYAQAVEYLNDHIVPEHLVGVFHFWFFVAIHIWYYAICNLYFKTLLKWYRKHPFHKNTQILLKAIVFIMLFFGLAAVILDEFFKDYKYLIERAGDITGPVIYTFIKIFNVISIPVFLYFYLNKFTTIKLELLDQVSRPKEPVAAKTQSNP